MKEDKNLARTMALLVLAHDRRNVGAAACPSPEEIAATAEGRLPWERRHPIMRHLAVCPECYRMWLEVARAASEPPFVLRWFCSFRTLAYAGAALAAAVCFAVFSYWHHPQEETVSRQQPAPPAIARDQKDERNSSARAEPHSPSAPRDGDGLPTTASDMAKSGGLVLSAGTDTDTRQRAARAGEDKMAAGVTAAGHETKVENRPLADKENGSIRIGVVEMRRSTDQLTVWYNDLREMCRLPNFLPDQWNSLHTRGTDILKALSESGQGEEIDRLWLMLGQMEGLTSERLKSFCAWSDKELARRQRKKE